MRRTSKTYFHRRLSTVFLLVGLPVFGGEVAPAKIDAVLQRKLLDVFKRAGLDEKALGISVVDLRSGERIVDVAADRALSPASAAKILTAYVVLKRMGVDYRFETTVRSSQMWNSKGVLKGDLILVGSGDPSLRGQALLDLAFQLKSAGLKRVDGTLVVDDSVFDSEEPSVGRIESDSMRPFNAPVSGLNINDNVGSLRVWSEGQDARADWVPSNDYVRVVNKTKKSLEAGALRLQRGIQQPDSETFEVIGRSPDQPVHFEASLKNPALYAGALLKRYLVDSGIQFGRSKVRRGIAPRTSELRASHRSEPLRSLVAEMNKNSSNVYADSLLRVLGHIIYGRSGTDQLGLQVIQEESNRLGLNHGGFKFVTASGLTRFNRMSAAHFTKLFQEAFRDFDVFPEWISSLSIAGIDGTLEKKMQGNPAFGRLRGKTGTIDGVSTLVGLVKTREGALLSYAALINSPDAKLPPSRKWQDEFGRSLATWNPAER